MLVALGIVMALAAVVALLVILEQRVQIPVSLQRVKNPGDRADAVDPLAIERAYVEQFTNEPELARYKRIATERFELVEKMEQQRDALWEVYRTEAAEHLNAQFMLERRLMTTRMIATRAVCMLNAMRKQAKLEPVKPPAGLEPYESEPVGTAKKYADDMLALCRRFPDLVEQAKPPLLRDRAKTERDGSAGDSTPA